MSRHRPGSVGSTLHLPGVMARAIIRTHTSQDKATAQGILNLAIQYLSSGIHDRETAMLAHFACDPLVLLGSGLSSRPVRS